MLTSLMQDPTTDYMNPVVIKDDFQSVQGQIACLSGIEMEMCREVSRLQQDLNHLWVQLLMERCYTRHLIEEHLSSL